MATNLSFTVEGTEVLNAQFRRLGNSISDLSPAFKAAEKVFLDSETDNFQSENTKGKSGRWQPLTPAYEKQKIRKYGTFAHLAGVEIASERLYKSLTGRNEDYVSQIGKDEASFGTNVPYAKAQHFGYAPRNLPARPLIDLSDAQLARMRSAMRKAIVTEVRKTTRFEFVEGFLEVG